VWYFRLSHCVLDNPLASLFVLASAALIITGERVDLTVISENLSLMRDTTCPDLYQKVFIPKEYEGDTMPPRTMNATEILGSESLFQLLKPFIPIESEGVSAENLVRSVLDSRPKSLTFQREIVSDLLRTMGINLFSMGNPRNALIFFLIDSQIFNPPTSEKSMGLDSFRHAFVSSSLEQLGLYDQAREWGVKSRQIAEKTSSPLTKALSYINLGDIESRCGDLKSALRWYALARDQIFMMELGQEGVLLDQLEKMIVKAHKRNS
jgi:hypothetical protein